MVNIAFSKLVKIGSRQWEINFRKLPSDRFIFHGDTPTLEGERIQFQLYREMDAAWKVCGTQVPEWICREASTLGRAAEQGLKDFFPQALERTETVQGPVRH